MIDFLDRICIICLKPYWRAIKMEIRNLNFFIKVAELQSFTLAAADLGYSQSNISTQIIQLEKELGIPLFNRVGRQVTLTQWGEVFLPYAKQIAELEYDMANFMKSDEALGGTIKIGMVESVFSTIDKNIFVNYHNRFPRLKIDLSIDCTETLKADVARGRLDVACIIDQKVDQSKWTTEFSIDAPIVLVCNPTNPLSEFGDIPLEILAGQDFVVMEDNSPYNIYNAFAEAGIEVVPFLKMQNAKVACELVEKNDYISLLPYYVVRRSVLSGKVKVLNSKGFSFNQAVQVILHKNRVRTPQIKGAVEILSEAIKCF